MYTFAPPYTCTNLSGSIFFVKCILALVSVFSHLLHATVNNVYLCTSKYPQKIVCKQQHRHQTPRYDVQYKVLFCVKL